MHSISELCVFRLWVYVFIMHIYWRELACVCTFFCISVWLISSMFLSQPTPTRLIIQNICFLCTWWFGSTKLPTGYVSTVDTGETLPVLDNSSKKHHPFSRIFVERDVHRGFGFQEFKSFLEIKHNTGKLSWSISDGLLLQQAVKNQVRKAQQGNCLNILMQLVLASVTAPCS